MIEYNQPMQLLKSITNRVLIESHRGAEGLAPENSWAALEAGCQAGADLLEVDVQLSGDEVAFLRHNYTLPDGRFCASTDWDEIKTLQPGDTFPLLEEALDWVKSREVVLSLDLKSGFQPEARLSREVLRLLERTKAHDQVMLISWDHVELFQIKQSHPHLMTRALLRGRLTDHYGYLKSIQVDAVSLTYGVVRPADVEAVHRAGVAAIMAEMWQPDFMSVLNLGMDLVSWGNPLEARRALGYL